MTPTPRSALAPAESQIAGLARRTQSFLDENWATAWQQHLPEIAGAYEAKGEPAYGVYTRQLFAPLLAEMTNHDLQSTPRLPGSFRNSEERWGAPANHDDLTAPDGSVAVLRGVKAEASPATNFALVGERLWAIGRPASRVRNAALH